MSIEKDRIVIENGNCAHGVGALNLQSFQPFPKNPPISKVFREIGFADELGSGTPLRPFPKRKAQELKISD